MMQNLNLSWWSGRVLLLLHHSLWDLVQAFLHRNGHHWCILDTLHYRGHSLSIFSLKSLVFHTMDISNLGLLIPSILIQQMSWNVNWLHYAQMSVAAPPYRAWATANSRIVFAQFAAKNELQRLKLKSWHDQYFKLSHSYTFTLWALGFRWVSQFLPGTP